SEEQYHRNQSEQPLMHCDPPSVQDRPRNQEHRLHVENHEQHGHDVKAHGISSARIALWRNSALIGLEFRANGGGGRPDELCQDQRYGRKRDDQHSVNQNWNVCPLHHSLTRCILPLLSIARGVTFRKATLRRGWWLSPLL